MWRGDKFNEVHGHPYVGAWSRLLAKTLHFIGTSGGLKPKVEVLSFATKENLKDYFAILPTFGVDFGWRRGYGFRFKTKVFVFF